jgi:hypothetical protein
MDALTGAVLSITADASGTATPNISIRYVCDGGDLCYLTNTIPHPDIGFYGTPGTWSGDWTYRSGFATGSYYGGVCWSISGRGLCSGEFGPNTQVGFTQDVTGTSATIY